MTKFITEFKTKAHNKNLTSEDMLMLCAYRAIKAKSPNKKEIFQYFARKAFSPKQGIHWTGLIEARKWLTIEIQPRFQRDLEGNLFKSRFLWGNLLSEYLDEKEVDLLDELMSKLFEDWS